MMFLQYGIWGAWLPILFPFLMGHRGFSLGQTSGIMAAGAVGAVMGPFIAGHLADRHFSTQKMLAVSHLIGAFLVWFLATVTSFHIFLLLSILYGLIYAPTLALTNSLAFHHLTDRDRQFGPIRLWGTIGWIAVGIGAGQWLLYQHSPPELVGTALEAAQNAGRGDAFRISAILGFIMGGYCMTLPHTPPAMKQSTQQGNASMQAIREVLRSPALRVLFLLAIPVSMIHQFYFVHTSEFLSILQREHAGADTFATAINRIFGVGGGGLMTIGQMMEIAVLALVPILAIRIGRKGLLAIGLLAYAARMAIFAYIPSIAPVLLGVAMHGLCFGCFIFVSFMIVDEETTISVRASAQNLLNLVIIGLGISVGSWVSVYVVGSWAVTAAGVLDYTRLFRVPMWASLVCLAVLILAYPASTKK
jgi:nucleoside transporter